MNIIHKSLPLLFVVVLPLAGCKSDKAPATSTANEQTKVAVATVDPATLGTVEGSVRFSGKAPERVKIDMSQDPACTLSSMENRSEQYVVENGKLANVFVYIKSTPTNIKPAEGTQAVTIDQKGCRFVPHVVALYQGGSVSFTNSDPTMHNVHTMPVQVGNRSVDVSEGPGGKPESVQFKDAENMLPVRCNNHPWMNAFVNVSPTPFFAVTGADGSFKIAGLPAGNYTIAFVHEKLGEQDLPVTIVAQKSTAIATDLNKK